jgi:cytochrome b
MTDAAATPAAERVPVWDPLVRIGHWLLLAAVATGLITRGEPESLHQAAGYVVGGYVVFRLVWGIVGPKRARFETFLRSPLAGLRYLADLVTGKAERHVGHSPAGGLMVVALLVALSGVTATGLAMENHVPVPAVIAGLAPVEAGEEGEAEDEEEGPWGEIHEAFANLVLGLAVLHVLGVAVASVAHRESLVRAMIDGRKRA